MKSGAHATHPADVGGNPTNEKMDTEQVAHHQWEKEVRVMVDTMYKGTWDRMRKMMEALPQDVYTAATYYERWALALIKILIEEKAISHEELLLKLGYTGTEEGPPSEPMYKAGDTVKVKKEYAHKTPWERPHLRTPGYIFGAEGVVERVCGSFPCPSLLAVGVRGNTASLYRVRFKQADLWEAYEGTHDDTIDVEVYESWLMPPSNDEHDKRRKTEAIKKNPHDYAKYSEGEKPQYQRVIEALKTVLMDKGHITLDALRGKVEAMDIDEIPPHGVEMCVRAWQDPEFKRLMLEDSQAAMKQTGLDESGSTTDEHKHGTLLVVVENTPDVHNVVVCTLCSCYPTKLLGKPPAWYKSVSYRSRVVKEPRTVLSEFGTTLPKNKTIRVHDSTADMRYLVLPERPAGTEDFTSEQLAGLLTRDALVGVTVPLNQ
eukprot:TRINITY_DN27639_c0_g1_i1.p1 TRINITY_DN27639_c0_g1~~TRINITY_DN27639_c0_g1_i1.p1  ORF type:complete len:449 (+),score=114.87 TRINITY_DN27639_c0_g1_i1:56-1348(+)